MAGGTHVFDMIKRLQENANLRSKRNYFKQKYFYTRTSKSIFVDNNIETEEQREEIKTTIKVERIKEKRKSIIVLTLSILLTVTLILLLLKFLKS